MTKIARALLFAGAGLLALASAAEAGTVRVTIAEYSKGTGPYFEAAAKAFEAANPGTKIQIEVVPWDNLQQKLTTDISAGANADLSIIGTRWLLDYVRQGVVAPLDSYVTPEFKARFIDTFLTPSVMDGKGIADPSCDLGGKSEHSQMVGIHPRGHALRHPDESPFLGGSQETSVDTRRLPKLGAASLCQSLGVDLLCKIRECGCHDCLRTSGNMRHIGWDDNAGQVKRRSTGNPIYSKYLHAGIA